MSLWNICLRTFYEVNFPDLGIAGLAESAGIPTFVVFANREDSGSRLQNHRERQLPSKRVLRDRILRNLEPIGYFLGRAYCTAVVELRHALSALASGKTACVRHSFHPS